jgi:hypothetical protein
MDLSSLEGVSRVDLQSRVSVAAAKKTLDATKSQGEAAVELIKAAGQVGKGGGGVDANGHVDVEA